MPDIIGLVLPPLGFAIKAGMVAGRKLRGDHSGIKARADFMAGLEEFIDSLPEERPLVIAIDDFHWADEPTSDLALYLARRVVRERFSLAILTRPHEQQAPNASAAIGELARLNGVETFQLDPFTVDDVERLLKQLAPDSDVDVRSAQLLADRCHGNPYFLTSWITYLMEIGSSDVKSQIIQVDERALEDLPPGLGPLLDAMLSGLDEPARTLIDAAAVLGEVFDPASAAAIAGFEELEGLRLLTSLERQADWLEPAGSELLRFDHTLLREHVYAKIPSQLRRAYHSAAADMLFDADASTGVVGDHLVAAGRVDEAIPFVLEAADEDLRLGSFRPAAIRLRALETPNGLEDRERFFLAQLRAEVGSGDVPSALASVERWKRIAGSLPEEAILQEAEAQHLAGDYKKARELVEPLLAAGHPLATIRGLHYLRFTDPTAAEAEAASIDSAQWPEAERRQLEYVIAANVLLQRDRVKEGRARLQALLQANLNAGHVEQAAATERRLADIALFTGEIDEAQRLLHNARQRAELCGSRQRIYLLVTAAEVARQTNALDRASALLGAAHEQVETLGIPVWHAHVELALGQVLRGRGDNPRVPVEAARSIYARQGVVWGVWHCDATLSLDKVDFQTRDNLAAAAKRMGLLTEARWIKEARSLSDHPLLFI
jgi:ATP/maltotriose-dependent transcriptional regulator MalT